jgi:hypothetical protein
MDIMDTGEDERRIDWSASYEVTEDWLSESM